MFPHVSPWLCKQGTATRSQGTLNLGKQSGRIINFMDHGEEQGEVDLAVKIRDAEGIHAAESRLDPIDHASAACAAHQRV